MKFVVRTLVISAAAAVAVSAAYAQSASIAKRQNILKGWGDATKPVAAMLKGEAAARRCRRRSRPMRPARRNW